MTKRERKLPDSHLTTTSVRRYLKEWKDIYQPLEEVYGLKLLGFDPGFLFLNKESLNWRAVDVPMWLAKRMLKVAKDKVHDPA